MNHPPATRRVVVTGVGSVGPVGLDVPTAWQRVVAGQSGVGRITLFPTDGFRVKVAGSSTKSVTGHLLGGAGATELIWCVMAIRDGILPPTINYCTKDRACDLDFVPNVARRASPRIALANSFGMGGHNTVLVIGRRDGPRAA